MSQNAAVIIRTACQLLAKYEGEAIRYAEARALENDPDPGASWRLIADTIRLLSEDNFMVPT